MNGHRVPDFIIIGAMKSGTTSLHHILAQHESVFIPRREVFFFDLDDREQHPDFRVDPASGRTAHDWDRDFDVYLRWYARFFEPAGIDQQIGEDSTTYLASRHVAERLHRVLPGVKLLAMLRDPVTRAYSHYWHNTAKGRTTASFDRTVREQPGNYLRRGHYAEQLRRFQPFLTAGQLEVVLYEDFVADTQGSIDGVCEFLGLDGDLDVSQIDSHRNPAWVPLIPELTWLANRAYQQVSARTSRRNVPFMPGYWEQDPVDPPPREAPAHRRVWQGLRRRLSRRRYPEMTPDTRTFLEQHFREANAGLSELIGRDVGSHWAYMR